MGMYPDKDGAWALLEWFPPEEMSAVEMAAFLRVGKARFALQQAERALRRIREIGL